MLVPVHPSGLVSLRLKKLLRHSEHLRSGCTFCLHWHWPVMSLHSLSMEPAELQSQATRGRRGKMVWQYMHAVKRSSAKAWSSPIKCLSDSGRNRQNWLHREESKFILSPHPGKGLGHWEWGMSRRTMGDRNCNRLLSYCRRNRCRLPPSVFGCSNSLGRACCTCRLIPKSRVRGGGG